MYHPSKSQFIHLSKKGNLIPVYKELLSDIETPVSAYLKLAHLNKNRYSYLLESVEGAEKIARYSIIGFNPPFIIKTKNENPLLKIKELMKRYRFLNMAGNPKFCGGLVGYIGYEVARFFEPALSCVDSEHDDLRLPDSLFMLSDTVVVFDHTQHKIQVVANADLTKQSSDMAYKEAIDKIEIITDRLCKAQNRLHKVRERSLKPPQKIRSNMTADEFKKIVIKAKRYIREGDIIQAVLSQRFNMDIHCDPFSIYRAIRFINPSPYMYYLNCDDFKLIGSSPEVMVRCEDRVVLERPIAGTRPRGKDEQNDALFVKDLISDEKEKAEHLMLVDLGRNDIGRLSEKGSVKVSEFMTVEKYSHVMHLVSNVTGRLSKGKDIYDVLRHTFPAGTVTGAPKIRAMEIINELEKTRRGPYAGCIGYFSFSGNMDTCITIRTVIIKDSKAFIQAGAGIVADSEPDREFKETVNKAKGMLKAIDMAHRGQLL